MLPPVIYNNGFLDLNPNLTGLMLSTSRFINSSFIGLPVRTVFLFGKKGKDVSHEIQTFLAKIAANLFPSPIVRACS